MKIHVGDIVTYDWVNNLSFHGLVIDIKDSSELYVCTLFELLEENQKRFWYDVWAGADEDKITIHNR